MLLTTSGMCKTSWMVRGRFGDALCNGNSDFRQCVTGRSRCLNTDWSTFAARATSESTSCTTLAPEYNDTVDVYATLGSISMGESTNCTTSDVLFKYFKGDDALCPGDHTARPDGQYTSPYGDVTENYLQPVESVGCGDGRAWKTNIDGKNSGGWTDRELVYGTGKTEAGSWCEMLGSAAASLDRGRGMCFHSCIGTNAARLIQEALGNARRFASEPEGHQRHV